MYDQQNYCGSVTVTLTPLEASRGCRKEVFCQGMLRPIQIDLQPGIHNGDRFVLSTVPFIGQSHIPMCGSLEITVVVIQPKKKRTWIPILAAAMVAVSLTVGTVLALAELLQTVQQTVPYYEGPELSAQDVILYYDQRYFLSQLTDNQLQTACILYQAVMNFEEECAIPKGISTAQIRDIFFLMKSECPELFQLDLLKDAEYSYLKEQDQVFSVKLHYNMTKQEYQDRRASCEVKINYFVSQTAGMTPLEKETYIFDRLVDGCWYELDTEFCGNAYGALIEDKAKCDGISLAMKWCMEAVGVQCLCIFGDAREGDVGHAWNMVCLDGNYYNVDLTGSMRHARNEGTILEDMLLYYAFNVSDAWAEKDYIVCKTFTDYHKPVCDTDAYSYYAQRGYYVVAGSDLEAAAHEAITQVYQNRERVVLHFATAEDQNTFFRNFRSYADSWERKHAFLPFSIQWVELSEYHVCIMRS